MGTRHRKTSAPTWEALAILRMASVGLLEALWGLLSWPFARRTEDVVLTYHPTYENTALLAGCPSLKNFTCSPWAPGPHAQTFFSVIKLGARPVPRKEEVIMPDGVQITILWFEPKDANANAPLVVSLHGIGGDENSVRPIMLAEECLRRGWRSVLYVRRGHGNSSLLPVGEATAASSPPAGHPPGAPGAAKAATATATATADTAVPAVESAAAAAVAAAAAAAAASSSDPVKAPTQAAAAATTVTIVATEAGDDANVTTVAAAAVVTAASPTGAPDLDSNTPTTPTSPAAFIGCLPKNISLPTFQMAAESVDIRAAAAAAADPETLRRTRKAFPQHADTEDLMVVLQHIRAARPQAIMVAVGFSMGSNVLVKFLGEHPPSASGPCTTTTSTANTNTISTTTSTNTATASAREQAGAGAVGSATQAGTAAVREEDPKNPLAAAISISNGYDIIEGTRYLVTSRPLADRIITGALHKLLRRKLPEVHAICAAHGVLVDFDEVLACSTIRDFERALMVPICGLDDVDEYYRHNNCRDALLDVRTPLLCLSARDDPIIDPSLLRYAETAAAANPHVILAVTRRGGHLGWLQGWAGRSWMMDVIVEYVESVARLHAQPACGAAEGTAAAPVCGKAAAQTVAIREGGGAAGGIGLRAFDSCFGCGTAAVDGPSREVVGRHSVDVTASAATKGSSPSVGAAGEPDETHGSTAAAADVVINLHGAGRSATTATADPTVAVAAASTATGA